MSAKWRALQHRHRYTYSAVLFPSSFTASLSQSSLFQCCPKFYADIEELVSLKSIYAQVNHAKKVVSSFAQLSNSDCDHRTTLYDGILLELCDLCEKPIDSHLIFHALTMMQICLQQIKTSMLTDLSEDYDPMPDNRAARVLRIILNNLEDPLSQTVKQVHLMFDLLQDIQTTVHQTDDKVGTRESLLKMVNYLLRIGSRCKGRYVPLASLTRRLGANTLMDMSPNLLFEMANAYIDDDVCYAVTSFMHVIENIVCLLSFTGLLLACRNSGPI